VTVSAGAGDDTVVGRRGTLDGDEGADSLSVSEAGVLRGGAGSDVLPGATCGTRSTVARVPMSWTVAAADTTS
jgi:Ca2+-binding RTX toxin-like protein